MRLKDYPNHWCIRITVYKPDSFRGQTHSSTGVTGPVSSTLGEFLELIALRGDRLAPEDFEALKSMTQTMKTE